MKVYITLSFRPSFEELKTRYYKEMRRFIEIPTRFKGFSEQTENLIFPVIIERNSLGLITCYRQSAILFRRVLAATTKFEEWVVFGSITDLDAFVDEHLTSAAHFEKNFKALKQKGTLLIVQRDCGLV